MTSQKATVRKEFAISDDAFDMTEAFLGSL